MQLVGELMQQGVDLVDPVAAPALPGQRDRHGGDLLRGELATRDRRADLLGVQLA
ncbi:hypothetical protein [Micromonospora sp. NPDC007230]|uniref:hypothetical protein n=1 Tax=Micromonospora sp. NPDC007230 TaxID=3364237 RepID=UPI0036C892C8